jgi:hypothetical protein
VTQPVDSSILHEIVRVIDSRRMVPEKVVVKSREYLLTYLEDHQRRLEEALQRFDHDRLNMLYGQLASKIKYQLLRRLPARAAAAIGAAGPANKVVAKAAPPQKLVKPAPRSTAKSARPTVKSARPAAKPAGKKKKMAAAKPSARSTKRTPAAKRPAAKAKRPAAKAKRPAAVKKRPAAVKKRPAAVKKKPAAVKKKRK